MHGQFRLGLDELRAAHTATLPALFGGAGLAEVPAPAAGVAGAVEAVPLPADAPATEVDPAIGSEPIATAGPQPRTGAVEREADADVPPTAAPVGTAPAGDAIRAGAAPAASTVDDGRSDPAGDHGPSGAPGDRAAPPVRPTGRPAPSTDDTAGHRHPEPGATEHHSAPDER